jgi:3-(3-hydroxy-phenyl)propionate hydroxylase
MTLRPSARENHSFELIVVGAGPTGMTAALAARKHGLRTLVIEADQEAQARSGSRALFIHREPLAVLESLHTGLAQQLIDGGLLWRARRYFYRGRQIYYQVFDEKPERTFGTSLPQAETERLLRQACQERGVEFHWGFPVTKVCPDSAGVTVHTKQGLEFRAGHVIGSDGARSAVRKSLNIPMVGTSAETRWVIVDVGELADKPIPCEMVFHYEHPALGGRNVLLVPFQGGWRIDLGCRAGDDVDWYGSEAGVREWLPKFMNARYADKIRWISTYRFNQLLAARFCDATRRVLLAGEAAHLFPPWGGRGLNSGVIDGKSAVDAVAAGLIHPEEAPQAVDEFDADRRDAARFNIESANSGVRLMTSVQLWDRVRRRVSGMLAPWSSRSAARLSQGPNGRVGGRPGKAGIY